VSATPDAIRDWVNERVSARFQKIDAVRIVAALPRNVAGKTLRRVLQQAYLDGENP
jgi:acyl-coenzyme A synthetase/AMP-(fatty) acid ligase